MSRPKSLNQDQEICRDLKISAFLDSLSRSRSAWIFVFFCRDFSICQDFSSFSDSKGLDCVSTNLDKSWQSWRVLTILNNLDKNLDASKSRLKSLNLKNLNREKKSWSWLSRKFWHFKKVGLNTKEVLDLDWSQLSRPPGLNKDDKIDRPFFVQL